MILGGEEVVWGVREVEVLGISHGLNWSESLSKLFWKQASKP